MKQFPTQKGQFSLKKLPDIPEENPEKEMLDEPQNEI